MELSKLKFCGFLNSETPHCVILEICQSYGIKINLERLNTEYKNKVLTYINNFKVPVLKCEDMPIASDTEEITKIATFINCSVSWSYRTLKRAFNFWISGSLDSDYYGNPTPAYPESITLTQCYTLCHVLTLTPETQAEQLIYYAKIIKNPEYLSYVLLQNIKDNLQFFDSVKGLKKDRENLILQKEDWTLCKNINAQFIRNIIPESKKIAISLATLYFDIDITETVDPISEYCILSKDPISYIPIDPRVARIYSKNPEAFKFSSNFNSSFSTEFYSPTILQKLVKFEGFVDIIDPEYTTLQTNTLIANFYSGFRLGIGNDIGIVYGDTISDLHNSDIITYGTPGNLFAFTINELIDSFNNNLSFVLPDNTTLSPTNINKLFNIAKNLDLPKIISTIKTIRSYESSKNKVMVKLFREYNNGTEDAKGKIREMAESLLHLGFRMRGWLDGDYPIVLCPVTEYEKVDLAITDAIIHFETCTSGKYGDLVQNFPLMKYVKGFIFSNSKIDGYTVIERINIVKEGESSSSCVRLSSNWICSTAYKIYELLKLPVPFKITDLRSIS